ncbi:MAG: DNA internalization-related competence protein ComEC/Rec2 [Bacteroidota bacterium]
MDWNRQPAVRLAFWITAGIIAGRFLIIPFSLLIAIETVMILLVYLAVGIIRYRYGKDLQTLLLILVLICIGVTKYSIDTTLLPRDHISFFLSHPRQGILVGTIAEQPEIRNDRLSFLLHTSDMFNDTIRTEVNGDVIVSLRYKRDDTLRNHGLSYGDVVAIRGIIEVPRHERNPGEFNYRNYLELNNIYAVMTVSEMGDIQCLEKKEGNLLKSWIILPIRNYVRSVVDTTIGGVEGAFLKGLIIGDRSEIPKEVQTSFINAGVVHILAVSGLNVAFVALIVVALSSFIPGSRIVKTCAIILTLLLYMAVAGSTPSIVRATLMVVVVLVGNIIQRRANIMNALAVSALIIYVYDARQFFDIGFQLSYGAVISLVLFYSPVESAIIPIFERYRPTRWLSPIVKLFVVSLVAQMGTLPLIVQYFGRISLVSFFANVVVVPAANIALALGIVVVVLSIFSSWCAVLAGAATHMLLYLTLKIITIAAHFRWSVLEVRITTAFHTIGYYILIAIVFSLWKGSWMRKGLILSLAVANIFVFYPAAGSAAFSFPPRMTVTFLDVGQGDATVIEYPDGKILLIDSGSRTSNSDAGQRVILPFLKWKGITHVDAFVLTHGHSDHVGGALSVIESIPVKKVYIPRTDVPSSLLTDLQKIIQEKNIPIESLSAGMQIDAFDNTRLYVLHPNGILSESRSELNRPNLNNTSIVLRLCYGRSSILLTGDAEEAVEQELCEYYGVFLHSSILKVAHHGSINASSDSFISTVKPAHAVVSVGKNNKFRHPSVDVISRYQHNSILIERTDEQGAVVFHMTADSVSKIQWR